MLYIATNLDAKTFCLFRQKQFNAHFPLAQNISTYKCRRGKASADCDRKFLKP